MEYFSCTQGQIYPHLTKFNLIQDLIQVLVICKFKKGSDQWQLRKSGGIVFYAHWQLRSQRWKSVQNSNSSQAFMHVLCNNEENPIKYEGEIWTQLFSNDKSMGIFRVSTTFPPFKSYGGYMLPWRDCDYLAQNLMQPFPHLDEASSKI